MSQKQTGTSKTAKYMAATVAMAIVFLRMSVVAFNLCSNIQGQMAIVPNLSAAVSLLSKWIIYKIVEYESHIPTLPRKWKLYVISEKRLLPHRLPVRNPSRCYALFILYIRLHVVTSTHSHTVLCYAAEYADVQDVIYITVPV